MSKPTFSLGSNRHKTLIVSGNIYGDKRTESPKSMSYSLRRFVEGIFDRRLELSAGTVKAQIGMTGIIESSPGSKLARSPGQQRFVTSLRLVKKEVTLFELTLGIGLNSELPKVS